MACAGDRTAYTMGFHPKPVDIIHDLSPFCNRVFPLRVQ